MPGFNIDEIDEELQRRIDAEIEIGIAKGLRKTKVEIDRLTALITNPGTCPFIWVERCGRTECSDVAICINCITARRFIDRSPTFTDINKDRPTETAKSSLTIKGIKDLVATFIREIIDQQTSTVVPRDIEEMPVKELQTIRVLTAIAEQLGKEEDETYNSGIAAIMDGIIQAIH